mmetsp:Transcript_91865/g.172997  ORF Transcript_91865/g.172997 Transcript_91865/m.172997 type:complete len:83 (+) Transcript_91865:54-302(+)
MSRRPFSPPRCLLFNEPTCTLIRKRGIGSPGIYKLPFRFKSLQLLKRGTLPSSPDVKTHDTTTKMRSKCKTPTQGMEGNWSE